MKLFRIDVQIAGTAYIKAPSAESARVIADALEHATLLVQDAVTEGESDVPISGRRYDDPGLPAVSLSPAMTIHGVWPDESPEEIE